MFNYFYILNIEMGDIYKMKFIEFFSNLAMPLMIIIIVFEDSSMKYECPCGYVYDPAVGDPENGIAPGTPFEEIPEDWVCPDCGLDKSAFAEV